MLSAVFALLALAWPAQTRTKTRTKTGTKTWQTPGQTGTALPNGSTS